MEYIEHLAVEGDRWDRLSYRYYGDPFAYEGIIVANPHVPIAPYIAAGTRLAIPLIEPDAGTASTEELPPWKR